LWLEAAQNSDAHKPPFTIEIFGIVSGFHYTKLPVFVTELPISKAARL
jgi:hypothetical protein